MHADLAALLLETTVASSAAILAVLALRRPLRRVAGAGAAYALWALVPLVLAAVLVPAAAEPVLAPIAFAAAAPIAAAIPGPTAVASIDVAAAVVGLWAVGAALSLAWLAWRQWRFRRDLGPLHRRPDGRLQSLATRGLPAVIGLLPRIVLPGDFDERYTAGESELVLAHEEVHLRRGDVPACALAAALRVLFWFNPLLIVAATLFRRDQELACDAAVLRRYPGRRRDYGEALLKTRLSTQPLPFGCHWHDSLTLKERFAMLKSPSPSPRRRFAGLLAVALFALVSAAVAWAAQPAAVAGSDIERGKLRLELEIKIDDATARTVRVDLAPGGTHEEDFSHAGQAWRTRWTVTPLADGTFDIATRLERDGEVVGEPRLIARDQAAIGIGEELPDGSFRGISIEIVLTAGPPAPGMAAPGIAGEVPKFPPAANAAGESGTVMLELAVDASGAVTQATVVADESTVAADSALALSALAAAKDWKLGPAMQDGQPIAGTVRVPVRFEAEPPRPAAAN